MDNNWIVDNLENALTTWNEKLAEMWTLLTESPQTFKGGTIWSTVTTINGAMQAIGYGLLVLFFAISIFKSSATFRDFQRPEYVFKHFIYFILAKLGITYGMPPIKWKRPAGGVRLLLPMEDAELSGKSRSAMTGVSRSDREKRRPSRKRTILQKKERTKAALMTATIPAHGRTEHGKLPNSTMWSWAWKRLWRIILKVLLSQESTAALKYRAPGCASTMYLLHRSLPHWSRGGKKLSGM